MFLHTCRKKLHSIYSLWLQLSFIATTCYQGKQLRGIYTFGTKNFTANDTLNFKMLVETNEKMKTYSPMTTHCGYFLQMEVPQSKRHGLVMQCNKTSTIQKPKRIHYNYTCTYSGGTLCTNASYSKTYCSDFDTGGLWVLVFTHDMFEYPAPRNVH